MRGETSFEIEGFDIMGMDVRYDDYGNIMGRRIRYGKNGMTRAMYNVTPRSQGTINVGVGSRKIGKKHNLEALRALGKDWIYAE